MPGDRRYPSTLLEVLEWLLASWLYQRALRRAFDAEMTALAKEDDNG